MPEQVRLQRTKTTIAILLAFQLLSGFFFSKVSFLSPVLRSIGECLMPRRTSSSLVWRASSDTSPPCPMATRFDFSFNLSILSSWLILPTAPSFTRRMLERPGESGRRRTEGWSAMLWWERRLSLWTPSSTRSGSSQSIVRWVRQASKTRNIETRWALGVAGARVQSLAAGDQSPGKAGGEETWWLNPLLEEQVAWTLVRPRPAISSLALSTARWTHHNPDKKRITIPRWVFGANGALALNLAAVVRAREREVWRGNLATEASLVPIWGWLELAMTLIARLTARWII